MHTCNLSYFIASIWLALLTRLSNAQQLIEVGSWADDIDLGSQNATMLAVAEEHCGPTAADITTCNLRTAFFYASSLDGSDVEIFVNTTQHELEMAQSASIQVSGPSTLKLDGNGHQILGFDGDTYFRLEGDIEVTFFNTTFSNFHASASREEDINGVAISAGDPASSLHINNCTFENSYTFEIGTPRGLGGAVFATGSLKVENSTFSNNVFSLQIDESGSLSQTVSSTPSSMMTSGTSNYSTPAPAATGNFTTPAPTAIGNFTTPDPTAIGNFTTPAPTAIGNFTTPAPTAIGNFTTPAPTAIGNFTTPAPTAIGNFTTPAPTFVGNFSTPSPTVVGNFSAGNSTTGNFTSGNVSMAGDEAMGVVTVSIAGSATLVQTPAPAGQAPKSESDSAGHTRFLQEDKATTTCDTYTCSAGYSAISDGTAVCVETTGCTDDDCCEAASDCPDGDSACDEYSDSSSENSTSGYQRRSGSAVYWNNSAMDPTKTLNIAGCLFSENAIDGGDEGVGEDGEVFGGTVVAKWGMVTIDHTMFYNNKAFFGAGLLVEGANLTVKNTQFTNNTAFQYGGGIVQLEAGFMDVQNSIFDGNVADNGGGALAVATASRADRYNLDNCLFIFNVAGNDGGGALYLLSMEESSDLTGIVTFTSPIFEENSASGNGSITSIACGNVVVESESTSEYEEDEGAFVIQNGFESCSSVAFLSTLEPGPELSGARFSDTGTSMLVTFAQDTDYGAVADLGGSFDCPLLLDYPGGSDADVCSWTSAASIQVTLHYNASVVPSDVISTLANKVALSTSPKTLNAESSVTISPPENPPEPQLVPEVWYTALAHCKDLVMDVSASTGGGGRVMESYQWELYDWTVEQESDAPSAEFDYAEEASAAGGLSKLAIPGAGRESENELTWYFNITATNWLGGIGWTSIEVLVSAATEDPPLLSLAGGATRTVLRAASLAIVANAEVENCVTNKTSELTYEWSELRTGGTFTSTSADPSMFKLPSHSLEIGVEYEFRVDVTDSVGYSSFATQVVTVESSSLIAAVAGGNSTVSAGIDLVLDLTATIDPDEDDGICQDCFYNVSCTGTLSGSACDLTLPAGETSNGALTFLAEELVSGETYTIQISSRRSTETTWSTTSTFFTVGTEEPMPILSITPLSVEKVNADTVVAIEAEITLSEDSSAIAEWTLTDGVLNGYDELKLAASSSLEYTSFGSGVLSANMVLSANSLVPGSSYSFSLSAAYVSGEGRRLQEDSGGALASIYFQVNTPPTGGVFEVSPTEGVAMADVFELNTYAWEDDVADLPLTYMFAYVSGSADEDDTASEMIVRAALESSEATNVFLPQGYGSNSTLIASVYALDALGAASRATFGVSVSAYEGGVEELSTLVEAVATEALAAGDTDTVMQVLDVASSSLNAANCTVAPDCAALNRDDCGTDGLREDNTCGECVSGFAGVVGPHNSQCVDTTALDATCSDGEKNGDETDVDCGGSSCSPCPSGSTCLVDTDCSYNNCPEPASTTSDRICVSPAKACPNDCGGTIRGTCEYVSSTSGAALTAADCLADTPTSTCRASCNCFDGYGGDGCQYSDSELEAAVETRERSLLYIQESAESLDISRDTISRQAVLLSKLSVVPQEMKASSVTLVLDLATETTHMADESGEGVASTAAFAVVEVIGQVTLASSFLEEESNMEGLSDVVGSLISAQVAGKVVGEMADEVSSDYFRLSTGIYDAATVGEVQISPPLTADDESVGRSASSIGLPSDVGDAFSDVSSMSLAVAEWIIDPRQTSNATYSGGSSNEVVSSVVRFYADPIESASSLSRRKLKGLNEFGGTSMLAEEERWRGRPRRRSLLEDIGSLEITIPNTVSQPWDPQDILTFTHVCEWDSTETQSSTCPNGTDITTVCMGTALTREVECSNNGTEPECASWQGSDESSSAENCQVSSFNESWTVCLCSYAATVGAVGDGTGSNQVDFASTFLDTAGEFISIWDEATTLTWTEVQSAAPIFATMGGILALAVISAGFGWRFDQKDRGRPAGCGSWLTSLTCWSKVPAPTTDNQGKAGNERRASTSHVPKRGMTRDECLKSLAAAVQGDNKDDVGATAPHHLGERRVRKSLKLLIMVHHDFVSVFYCFYEWFTRPHRVALLLCSVVTLMATEATVFASIMFKDDGTCGAFENLADCAASSTANVNVAGVGSSCAWDEGSRTCYLPEPEEDMETSLVISTISLILALPLELFLVAVFAAFLVRPTKTKDDRAGTGDMEAERGGKAPNGKSGGNAIASSTTVDHVEKDATSDFEARLTIEVDLARAAEHRRESKMTRFWRSLCCGCGFCGDGAKREARLEKKVKRSLGPAISLEKRIAQTADVDSKEALLFEQAEADSLNYLERQVFFSSRILNYGEEDSLSGVPLCVKWLAWLFIVVYAVGLSFYVCLFAVKAGRATSVQWMISFWVAFFEDIFLLVPLKLAFVYLFLPSLMRHRMRSDMFTRIPRHATSVQVARRHPNMEVSGLILQGRIPHGNEFEKFIPLFTARSRWYTCMTGLVFTVLAIIMLLPDTLQAMVLDVLIAVMVGGGVFALAKLFPLSFWGFVSFFVVAVVIMIVLWTNHKRTMKKEKRLRKARVTQGGYSSGNGTFSGVNVLARGRTSGGRTPNFNTPSPGLNIVAGDAGFQSDQQSPTMNTASLARWVSAVKPGSVQPPQVDQQTEPPPRPPRAHHGRANSVASIGMISEAGSRWDNHGRLDSCAASAWGEVYVSDVESSVNEDGGNGDDESSTGTGPRLHGRDYSVRRWNLEQNEWDGLGNTLSLENSVELGTTASSTFFDDLGEPSHRADVHSRSLRGNSYEDNEESKSPERSPGSIAEARAAGRTSSSSRYDHSRRRVKAAGRGERDGDGSPRSK